MSQNVPKPITVTIDGQPCAGVAGQTILDIASAHGIHIPTLCYLKGLSTWGGCRMCIVEIKGSPKVVPSCATPALDGQEITAHSPRLEMLRRNTLELLFSERNHICPICPMNKGDCDLQNSAYEHGMDRVRYPYLFPALPVDVSGTYFGIDHNRCILCTRCVRSCDEQEGVHTLDIAARGEKNRVVVDLNATFGTSETCTQCGVCVANCPTGALFDKAQFYRGKLHACQVVHTTCQECPVGCGVEVYTKENRIVNVLGDPATHNHGHLCRHGRYETWAEPRERITQPLVRRDGKLVPATWDEATAAIKEALDGTPNWQTGLLVTPRLTNEAGRAVQRLSERFERIGMFVHHHEAALVAQPETIKDGLRKIDEADGVILLGVQLARDHGVLAARVRNAVRRRGAKLLVFHARKSDLDQYADVAANIVSMERSFWKQVATTLAGVKHPVLVYGPDAMSPIGVTVLERLIRVFEAKKSGSGPAVVAVPRSTNSLGLAGLDIEALEEIAPWLDAKPLSYLHIVAGDEPDGAARLLEERHVEALLSHLDCLVVQAAYASACD
jgi:formate dehydrogenase major subunit